ncbi:MAG: hypothetical protein H6Q25_838 [Bacteroidetes bacterium]|nr:hypothetical protein [Bacteroidota bacterium]
MTKSEFIDRYIYTFEPDFANSNRDRILLEETLYQLFEILNDGIQYDIVCPKERKTEYYQYLNERGPVARQQIVFRCAYILEKIYFYHPPLLQDPKLNFIELCLIVKNKSAMRHFSKILATALQNRQLPLTPEQREQLIIALAGWASDPQIRVAVKVWVFECFIEFQKESETAREVIRDLWELFSINPTPGMVARLKQWYKKMAAL